MPSAPDDRIYVVTHVDIMPNYTADGASCSASSVPTAAVLQASYVSRFCKNPHGPITSRSWQYGKTSRLSSSIWRPSIPGPFEKSCSRCWAVPSTNGCIESPSDFSSPRIDHRTIWGL